MSDTESLKKAVEQQLQTHTRLNREIEEDSKREGEITSYLDKLEGENMADEIEINGFSVMINLEGEKMKNFMIDLTHKLQRYSYFYYVYGKSEITDAEYDLLYKQLKTLEERHPDYRQPDSPTQKIGSDLVPNADFARVKHIHPILSLANAFDQSDLDTWLRRNQAIIDDDPSLDDVILKDQEYILEPKLDGLTLVLTYEKGLLKTAVTRGDGEEGDDVTANARTIRNLPLRLMEFRLGSDEIIPDELVVRGEVLFTNADFERFNAAVAAKGEEPYANARNTASGSLKQKYPSITADRPLSFFAYSIEANSDGMPETHDKAIDFLRRIGFDAINYTQVTTNFTFISGILEAFEHLRSNFGFETDGVVIKLNNIKLNDTLGISGKDPRGSIAYKFSAEIGYTELKDVVWTVGRSGRLTPNAVLQPLSLGGTTISAASLHNMDTIQKNDIRKGDRVMIKRAGEVIPYVVGPVINERKGGETEIKPPDVCPVCGTKTVRYEGEVDYNCPNRACPERVYRNIENFVGKEYYDIDGVGPGVIRALFDQGLIKDEADIFFLKQHKDAMLKLDKFGERKVQIILDAVDKARQKGQAWQLVAAINISNVGRSLGKALMKHYGTIDKLMAASEADLKEVEGVGSTTAALIVNWFKDAENMALMNKFRMAELNFGTEIDPKETKPDGKFAGLTFVITGTMIKGDQEVSRSDVIKMIENNGGKCSGSVSKKTDYVVVGPGAGSKEDKAKELKRPIINYEKLLEMIG